LNQRQRIEDFKIDQRRNLAEQRQGRLLCNDVISKILHS